MYPLLLDLLELQLLEFGNDGVKATINDLFCLACEGQLWFLPSLLREENHNLESRLVWLLNFVKLIHRSAERGTCLSHDSDVYGSFLCFIHTCHPFHLHPWAKRPLVPIAGLGVLIKEKKAQLLLEDLYDILAGGTEKQNISYTKNVWHGDLFVNYEKWNEIWTEGKINNINEIKEPFFKKSII